MTRPHFDQRDQSVDQQQNAGRDIHNYGGSNDTFFRAFAMRGCLARGLMLLGTVITLVGFGIWMATIFGAMGNVGSGPRAGLPVSQLALGFALFLAGGIIMGIGTMVAYVRPNRP